MKIEQTSIFKRDFKRMKNKHYNMHELKEAVTVIADRDLKLLKTKYKDHHLKGEWKGYRELHIQGDWLLIYKIDKKRLILTLTRTGSHDELL